MKQHYSGRYVVAALLACAGFSLQAGAATPAAVPLIAGAIDDGRTVQLDYDAPLSMHAVTDNGALDGAEAVEHVKMVLKRSTERQAALDKLVSEQLDPASDHFHKWVKPSEFGETYGPADVDVAKVTAWLASHGFSVGAVSPDKMSIDFSGTAAQVAAVFKTEIHDVAKADGEHHLANMSAPAIPEALSAVVHGVTLSNFFPKPMMKSVGEVRRDGKTGRAEILKPGPDFTVPLSGGGEYLAVVPQDFATIYNLTPLLDGTNLFGAPITGKGVTLVLAEQTNIKPADWNTFRSNFGLSGYAGTLSIIHPNKCANPGFTADEGEAALDAEWSSAVAPDASIVLASCAGTSPYEFGVMNTLSNLVNYGPTAAAISISYGGCEAGNGVSFLQMWTNLVEQAAAEGISVFVSAGDELVAGCDNPGAPAAKFGLAVNGLASNPYDTVAGGTDFSDTYSGTTAEYWSPVNDSVYGSALSYIPEIPWNNSCASPQIWKYEGAANGIAYCNTAKPPHTQDIVGGSGGKSAYYSKPDWQPLALRGVPNDGARDLPDVSLFAANGIWNHFYIFCMSDKNQGGSPCKLNNTKDINGNAAGGTSFVAPILAGVQALVAQVKGERVGNAAPRYYQLAQQQYSAGYLASNCLSNKGANIPSTCVFNELTTGSTATPCVAGSPNCYVDSDSTAGIGILSTSKTKEQDAYPEALGYNLATGLGSLNIANLLYSY